MISRRAFLEGAASLTAALPFLAPMKALASSPPPRRIVFFFSPNGTVMPSWRPTGTESQWTLSPILEPLAPFKDELLVISGLMMRAGSHGEGDRNHGNGINHVLTGMEWQSGQNGYGCATVDQFIAERLAGTTPQRSIEFGALTLANPTEDKWQTYFRHMSARGPHELVPRMVDPYESFARLFNDAPQAPSFDRTRAERRSVLDYVARELGGALSSMGAAERFRVQAHLDAVRDIERRLNDPSLTGACARPVHGDRLDHQHNDNFPMVIDRMIEQTAAALACGITRVASIQCSKAVSRIVHANWVPGATSDHHSYSHHNASDAAAADVLTRINRWYASKFAYLLQRLAEIPEDGGTLLDNTVCVWVNELGQFGPGHSREPIPYVLAGSCGGAFRTGRYIEVSGRQNNDLLISLCHAMGQPVATYGNPAYCQGPLAQLA